VLARLRESIVGANLAGDLTDRLVERVTQERTVLEAERRRLPVLIAELSTQAATLTDRLLEMQGPGAKAVESRLDEHSLRITEAEERLAEVERKLAALMAARTDAAWVAKTLSNFEAVWAHLTPANRQRLVRALVQSVVIDEPAGTITVTLVDLLAPELEAAS
jgi:chromosome segregation ATPase